MFVDPEKTKNGLTRYATLTPAVVDQTLTSVGIPLGDHGYLIVPVLWKKIIRLICNTYRLL